MTSLGSRCDVSVHLPPSVLTQQSSGNAAERALRPAVLWRKGSFGSDSAAGSRFVERLLTVVATCRQQGRPLLDFLFAAGEATLRGISSPSLLPIPWGG
jgi:transposase